MVGSVQRQAARPGWSVASANENGPGAAGSTDDCCAGLEAQLVDIRAENARLRLILDSAVDYAIITIDADGSITSWNPGAERTLGYTEAEVLGRSGSIVFTAEDRAAGKFTAELGRALAHGTATNERWHLRRDGTRFWASGTTMPLSGAGQRQGFLTILRDRTEQRAETERRELLIGEMSHRIKNTFAVVQAVAARSSRHAGTTAEFLGSFDARLHALASSHDVLVRTRWDDAPLGEVVAQALAAYEGTSIRIAGGPGSLTLAASLVVTVSLAFHELATNAIKHGALSVPEGRVEVSWTAEDAGTGPRKAHVLWREVGGPPVRPPERSGFGSHLLDKGMGGIVRLEFLPEGVECRMTLPVGGGR